MSQMDWMKDMELDQLDSPTMKKVLNPQPTL